MKLLKPEPRLLWEGSKGEGLSNDPSHLPERIADQRDKKHDSKNSRPNIIRCKASFFSLYLTVDYSTVYCPVLFTFILFFTYIHLFTKMRLQAEKIQFSMGRPNRRSYRVLSEVRLLKRPKGSLLMLFKLMFLQIREGRV